MVRGTRSSSARGSIASRKSGLRGDVQARRLASDSQARAGDKRRTGDVQFQARTGDVQRGALVRSHIRPMASDLQRLKLPDDLRNILVERYEAVARAFEAEAELALARGTLARLEARLAEMGYFIND